VVGRAVEAEVRSLAGELGIERDGRGVAASVTGTAAGTRPCDRCGQPVEVAFDVDQRLTYRPAREATRTGEIELDEQDLDEGFFDGEAIETDDVLSEAFALAAPLRVTCAADACRDTGPLHDRD